MTSLPPLLLTWFGLLALATSSDVAVRRIPNAVVVLVAVASVALRLEGVGLGGALDAALAGLLVAVPLFLAWRRKLVGAGDVKLATAVALGIGTARLGWFAVTTALAAGLAAVASGLTSTAAARRDIKANLATLALGLTPQVRPDPGRRSVPCAVAVTVGAVTAMLWRH